MRQFNHDGSVSASAHRRYECYFISGIQGVGIIDKVVVERDTTPSYQRFQIRDFANQCLSQVGYGRGFG